MEVDFFKFLLQSDNELLVSAMQKNGVADFISMIKCAENYPDFENLAPAIQYGVQEFIIKIYQR